MKIQNISLRLLVLCACFLTACTQITPSQYDLRLKSHTKDMFCDRGGMITQTEITIDSRRYQELNSEQQIFLSYHILDSNGKAIVNDGIRTALTPIPARGVGKETIDILVPNEEGEYLVDIDLVEENVTWFSAQGMPTLQIPMSVKESTVADYSQVTLTSPISNINVKAQEGLNLPLTIHNNSGIALCNSGAESILLSYHVKDLSGNILAEGERRPLLQHISSGENALMNISPQTEMFKVPGTYQLEVGLLIEGTAWLQEWGAPPLVISVFVK